MYTYYSSIPIFALPYGFNLAGPVSSVELQAMALLDTDDRTAVGAPLLASDENRIGRIDDDHDSRLLSDPNSKGSGASFVWALTSSAGISGLLFGYEYERGSIFQTNISPNMVIAADVLPIAPESFLRPSFRSVPTCPAVLSLLSTRVLSPPVRAYLRWWPVP